MTERNDLTYNAGMIPPPDVTAGVMGDHPPSSEDEQCPVCGYYCLGHGGAGCIDKPSMLQTSLSSEGRAFADVVHRVCRDLPGGFELSLSMEQGAAWVSLSNPDGDSIAVGGLEDMTLLEQIDEVVRVARREVSNA